MINDCIERKQQIVVRNMFGLDINRARILSYQRRLVWRVMINILGAVVTYLASSTQGRSHLDKYLFTSLYGAICRATVPEYGKYGKHEG